MASLFKVRIPETLIPSPLFPVAPPRLRALLPRRRDQEDHHGSRPASSRPTAPSSHPNPHTYRTLSPSPIHLTCPRRMRAGS
jgi:hypothetical protein